MLPVVGGRPFDQRSYDQHAIAIAEWVGELEAAKTDRRENTKWGRFEAYESKTFIMLSNFSFDMLQHPRTSSWGRVGR